MTRMTPGGAMLSRPRVNDPGRYGLITLGIVLIVAFLLPVLEPDYSSRGHRYGRMSVEYRAIFVNIELLFSDDDDIPATARFMAVYPALAGIAIVIVAAVASGFVRAGIVTGLGAVLYLVMFLAGNAEGSLHWLVRFAGGVVLIYVLLLLGLTGVLAGCVGRCYRSGSLFAAVVGIVGGALFLLALLLPVLPQEAGLVLLAMPFKLMSLDEGLAVIVGALLLLAMAAWITASIVCFANIPARRSSSARALGTGGFYAVLVGAILLLVAVFIPFCRNMDDEMEVAAGMLAFLKMGSWAVGLFLILPLGLAALAVAHHDATRGAVAAGTAAGAAYPPVGGVRPPLAAPPARPPADAAADRLRELQRLQAQGLISQAEYEEQRKRILSSI